MLVVLHLAHRLDQLHGLGPIFRAKGDKSIGSRESGQVKQPGQIRDGFLVRGKRSEIPFAVFRRDHDGREASLQNRDVGHQSRHAAIAVKKRMNGDQKDMQPGVATACLVLVRWLGAVAQVEPLPHHRDVFSGTGYSRTPGLSDCAMKFVKFLSAFQAPIGL